jgi:hypothetical protein
MPDVFIGLVSGSPDLTVTSCYFDNEKNLGTSSYAEGRETFDMQIQGTFIGWPFGDVWSMGTGSYLYPVLEPGTPAPPEPPKKEILIRYRNDNGSKWSNYLAVSLGDTGDTNVFKRISGLGAYRTRQYEIVCTSGVPITIAGVEEDVKVNAI